VAEQLQVVFYPFLACLVLTGMHVYLGIHVISRKVIFVDIALAQIAALGATVAFLLGYDAHSRGTYVISLGFAVLAAAIFAMTRTRHDRVPQEAVIGLTYATAAAAAILLADIAPHGAEHLHDLLAGSIVWVTPGQVLFTALLYAAIGVFHFVYRKRFLQISLHTEQAYERGVRVRLWDFLFYLSFGLVITSSVQIAGVLLVFCYLVAPSVFAVMFFEDLKRRLITGWTMAALVSALGLAFSYDRPSGPTIIVAFALALLLAGIVRAIVISPNKPRAMGITVGCLLLVFLIAWGMVHFRPFTPSPHDVPQTATLAQSPEHPLGDDIPSLRDALHDSHENVRAEAVARLAETGDPRVVPDLLDALQDHSPAVREAAAVALAQGGHRSALPALRQGLRNTDEDGWVRLRMAQAAAGMGDVAGLEPLLDLARGEAPLLLRMEALSTLSRLAGLPESDAQTPGSPGFEEQLQKLDEWWRANRDSLRWNETGRVYRAHP
jgi:zinc/manganese transport system permease protein